MSLSGPYPYSLPRASPIFPSSTAISRSTRTSSKIQLRTPCWNEACAARREGGTRTPNCLIGSGSGVGACSASVAASAGGEEDDDDGEEGS